MFQIWMYVSVLWAEPLALDVPEQNQWWNTWEDPVVVSLVEEGLNNAPDVRIALYRVQQAEMMSKQLRAGFLPSVALANSINMQPADALGFGFGLDSLDDLFPSNPNDPVEEEEGTDIFSSANLAIQVGLPLDIWGSNIASFQAAKLDAYASDIERISGLRVLSTTIVNAYYDLMALQHQAEIATEQRVLSDAMLEIATMRHQRDDATVLDVLQQRQQQFALAAQEVRSQQQVQLAEQRLVVLLGRSPTDVEGVSTPLLMGESNFPSFSVFEVQDVSEILDERWDVRAATVRVQSAQKRHYSALTQLLPTVSINGQLSRQANYRGDEEADWNTLDAWSAGGALNLTVFQGGNKWAVLESAELGVVIAEETLRKTRLQAEQEVYQMVISEKTQKKLHGLIDGQVNAARLAYQEAVNMYQKGITPYITVLSTQQALQQAEVLLVQTKRDGVRIRLQTINALVLNSTTK